MRNVFRAAIVCACVGLLAATAAAENYPTKPVRIVIPFPPGAGPDIVARTIGPVLSKRWGQQIVVDNRPGGGGNIATELAARAPADGYTLLLASDHFTVNPSLFSKVAYDPVRDFVPITDAAFTPNILVVHPSLPVHSVKGLIALAKSRPMQINFASGGNGSVGHLAGEMFDLAAGVRMVHVPYKGPVAAMTSLLNGETQVGFLLVAAVLPQVEAGKLRALAITGSKRSPAAPQLPTLAEAGVPNCEIVAWQGLFAPAGTPPDVVKKIYRDTKAALDLPEIKHALLMRGLETVGSSPQDFSAYIKADIVKWAKIVKEAHIHVD